MVGIAQTSALAVETLSKIIDLKAQTEKTIQSDFGKRIQVGLILHNHLLMQPLVEIKEVQKVCSLSPKSAGDLVKLYEKHGLLKEFTGNFRNRIFMYKPYLSLFED